MFQIVAEMNKIVLFALFSALNVLFYQIVLYHSKIYTLFFCYHQSHIDCDLFRSSGLKDLPH